MLRTRRIRLVETSRGLRVKHRHRYTLPGLDAALATYAPAVRVWHHIGGAEMFVPAPWRAEAWDAATQLYAAWFGLYFGAPDGSVSLRPGETVIDWSAYRSGLADRLALGPDAPGAARVKDDLVRLFARFALTQRAATSPQRRLAA